MPPKTAVAPAASKAKKANATIAPPTKTSARAQKAAAEKAAAEIAAQEKDKPAARKSGAKSKSKAVGAKATGVTKAAPKKGGRKPAAAAAAAAAAKKKKGKSAVVEESESPSSSSASASSSESSASGSETDDSTEARRRAVRRVVPVIDADVNVRAMRKQLLVNAYAFHRRDGVVRQEKGRETDFELITTALSDLVDTKKAPFQAHVIFAKCKNGVRDGRYLVLRSSKRYDNRVEGVEELLRSYEEELFDGWFLTERERQRKGDSRMDV